MGQKSVQTGEGSLPGPGEQPVLCLTQQKIHTAARFIFIFMESTTAAAAAAVLNPRPNVSDLIMKPEMHSRSSRSLWKSKTPGCLPSRGKVLIESLSLSDTFKLRTGFQFRDVSDLMREIKAAGGELMMRRCFHITIIIFLSNFLILCRMPLMIYF